jgi:hypothetical protein
MVFPVQSAVAAGLLLTLVFSLNDSPDARTQPDRDASVQLACDQSDGATVPASGTDMPLASACSRTPAR